MQYLTFEKDKHGVQIFKSSSAHKHNLTNCFEIFIFENANGTLELNGQAYKIGNTSVFFIPPNQQQKWNFDTKKLKGYHLVFQYDFFSSFFEDKLFAYRLHYFFSVFHYQYLQLNSANFEFIKQILIEITDELKNLNNDRLSTTKSLLHIVFIKLNKLFAVKHKLSSETQGNAAIYKFKETLERNIRKFHMVDDYCDILQVQRNKLNRIVKTHYGKTVKETIHARLLKEIKLELLCSHKTVVQIAKDLNFSEPNNMTRFFNRLEGVPPSIFREKNQK